MKISCFKKMLMMFALVMIVQNGAIIVSNVGEDSGSYSEEGGAAPCSDIPDLDDSYD